MTTTEDKTCVGGGVPQVLTAGVQCPVSYPKIPLHRPSLHMSEHCVLVLCDRDEGRWKIDLMTQLSPDNQLRC